MKKKIEFWFDFASTYSYPSVMRIPAIADRQELEIVYRPFLLGAIFKKQGWDTSPFILFPPKGKYMWRDLEMICNEEEIPFTKPSVFPRNGLLASRIVCAYESENWIVQFIRAVFQENFANDQDISSSEVITKILRDLNLPPEAILTKANLFETKQRLKEQTESAYEKGIFGAPTFQLGEELFWGNDRFESAIKWSNESLIRRY